MCVFNPPNAQPLVLERVPSDTEARQGGPAAWIHTKVRGGRGGGWPGPKPAAGCAECGRLLLDGQRRCWAPDGRKEAECVCCCRSGVCEIRKAAHGGAIATRGPPSTPPCRPPPSLPLTRRCCTVRTAGAVPPERHLPRGHQGVHRGDVPDQLDAAPDQPAGPGRFHAAALSGEGGGHKPLRLGHPCSPPHPHAAAQRSSEHPASRSRSCSGAPAPAPYAASLAPSQGRTHAAVRLPPPAVYGCRGAETAAHLRRHTYTSDDPSLVCHVQGALAAYSADSVLLPLTVFLWPSVHQLPFSCM
jgi:hypothetical protein